MEIIKQFFSQHTKQIKSALFATLVPKYRDASLINGSIHQRPLQIVIKRVQTTIHKPASAQAAHTLLCTYRWTRLYPCTLSSFNFGVLVHAVLLSFTSFMYDTNCQHITRTYAISRTTLATHHRSQPRSAGNEVSYTRRRGLRGGVLQQFVYFRYSSCRYCSRIALPV